MEKIIKYKQSSKMQYVISIASVFFVSTVCFFASKYIDYRITALLLLLTVSIIAILFDILPVLITAVSSSLILNFFFIQPTFTFHISSTEDLLLFFIYVIIALVNAVLTFKIREAETKVRDKEEKEKTIKLYNTLINSLSHELRTPIATIIGSIDILKHDKNKLSDKNQIDLLDEIDKASIRLNGQFENLLNMSRLESGMLKLKYDWCDINELVFKVIQNIEPICNEHSINFVPNDNLPLFKIDAGIFEEVIQNLVTNAILYTPKDTVINISASCELNQFVFSISDTGNGFPENEIQFAFDKFYRVPNTKSGGSGLGLSIVKGFVEAHDGVVKLENNLNSGACFTIEIPSETSYLKNLNNE